MQPHPDRNQISIACAIVTVSDTRTPATDVSGNTIAQMLVAAGHTVSSYEILPDEPIRIAQALDLASKLQPPVRAIIFNGGTGIAARDTTYDAIAKMLTKTMPGFGEIFRYLSYQEIGSRAISSRAIAGIYGQMLVFSLPGSSGAVKLGMEKLIIPELIHLVTQLR
jgi:molybdopterin adenylyltransferase